MVTPPSHTYLSIHCTLYRFKQQLAQNASSSSFFPSTVPGGNVNPQQPQNPDGFIRVPIAVAKKLRWFDQGDIRMLIRLHLREKQELFHACSLLREALIRVEGLPNSDVSTIFQAIDNYKSEEDSINTILALSAQEEIERLKEENVAMKAQITCEATTSKDADADADDASLQSSQSLVKQLRMQLEDSKREYESSTATQMDLLKIAEEERLKVEQKLEQAEKVAAEAQAQARAAASGAHDDNRKFESLQELQNQLDRSRQQIDALESKVELLENEQAKTATYVAELEEAAHERDSLWQRLLSAESRLDESRTESMTLGTLKDMLQASDARRMKAEEELVALTKFAANLETQLAEAKLEVDASNAAAQSAIVKLAGMEDLVEAKVQDRWEQVGKERLKWPPSALEEIEVLEARCSALSALQSTSNQRLQTLEAQLKEADARASIAESRVDEIQRSVRQRENRLEAAALLASKQVDEFRDALQQVERENKVLTGRLQSIQSRSKNVSSMMFDDSNAIAMTPTDVQYLKHVLLRFLSAYAQGHRSECDILLQAMGTVLRASASEVKQLRNAAYSGTDVLGWLGLGTSS